MPGSKQIKTAPKKTAGRKESAVVLPVEPDIF